MTHMGTSVLGLGAMLSLWGAAAPAWGQNVAAFAESGQAATRYTLTPVAPIRGCGSLRTAAPGELTILSAVPVAATATVPGHCRIEGTIAPEVAFQVNLPDHWNRRFYMFGNGGYAGETADSAPRDAVRDRALSAGFATGWTNTGHDARREPLGSFAVNQAKLVDYAFRAVHVTVVTAKRLVAEYYGRPTATSYWDGCSTGGREGLMEAQRFPLDFDGVLAGAPVERFTDSQVVGLWNGKAVVGSGLTPAKMKTVSGAASAKCADPSGVIVDPRQCDFDPARDVKQCAPGVDEASCLTGGQAEAIKKVYAGVVSRGVPYFHGYMVGSEVGGANAAGPGQVESGWDEWLIGRNGAPSRQQAYGESFLRYLAGPTVDMAASAATFDFDAGPERMGAIRGLMDADSPDLGAFRRHGGKLMMYHGWADTALTPLMSIDYFERASAAAGSGADDSLRLYMIPGMAHCRGGIGADRFDAMSRLVDWVENGVAPGPIPASRAGADGQLNQTRPMCPYPQAAVYNGSGDVNAAGSYTCKVP